MLKFSVVHPILVIVFAVKSLCSVRLLTTAKLLHLLHGLWTLSIISFDLLLSS